MPADFNINHAIWHERLFSSNPSFSAMATHGHQKQLEISPFSGRVGGHVMMFRLSDGAIAKAIAEEEKQFYEDVQQYEDFKLFISRYMGVVRVSGNKMPTIFLEQGSQKS